MQKLPTDAWPRLRPYFGDDRAGNLLGPHTLGTGHGEWWVDSWPQPAVLLVFVGGNMALLGDPGAASRGFLAEFVRERLQSWERIFVDAPGPWEPLVVGTLAPLQRWPRVALRLVERSPHEPESGEAATWTTWPSNRASLRVAQKLGFERVGEDHAWIAGEPLDE